MRDAQAIIAALYHQHSDAIFRFVLWHTGDQALAEDIVGETFTKAWKYHKKITSSTAAHQKAWLYRTARTTLIDQWRKPLARSTDALPEITDDRQGPSEQSQANERKRSLERAVGDLPELMRSVIIMRYFDNLSTEHVATALDISPGNVRVIQHRALRQLKKSLPYDI